MSRDGCEIREPAGVEVADEQLNQFHRASEENEHTRQIILSPEREMSDEELDRATRRTMNDFCEDKDSAEWVYAVHSDENDVHVAVTGDINYSQRSGDMWLDRDDLTELQDEIAADHFRDHTTEPQRELMIEQGREDELREEQQLRDSDDRDRDSNALAGLQVAKEAATPDLNVELNPAEREPEPEHERDRGGRSR
jgi:uncharacterized protein YdeI (BOF family)